MFKEDIEEIKSICGILDCDCYGKDCNFIEEDDVGNITFYSRDLCKSIQFKDLIKWYIPRLGRFEEEDFSQQQLRQREMEEEQLEIFLQLIELYGAYIILFE